MYHKSSVRYNLVNNFNFCSNNTSNQNCYDCPKNSLCSSGVIVGCERGYSFVNKDLCLDSKQLDTLLYKMFILSFQLAADANTEKVCQGTCNHFIISLYTKINLVSIHYIY